MKKLFLLLLALNVFVLSSQNFNQLVPSGIYPYEFNSYTNDLEGYYLTTPVFINNTPANFLSAAYIIDNNGDLIWYTASDYLFLLDFKFLVKNKKFSITKSDLNIYNNPRYHISKFTSRRRKTYSTS